MANSHIPAGVKPCLNRTAYEGKKYKQHNLQNEWAVPVGIAYFRKQENKSGDDTRI